MGGDQALKHPSDSMGKPKEDKTKLAAPTDAPSSDAKPAVRAPQSEVQRKCHDLPFALLFVLAFGLTLALAFAYGEDVLLYSVDSDKYSTVETVVTAGRAKYKYALRICAGIAGGALVASVMWTLVMLVCGKMLIWISVMCICALSLGSGYMSTYFLKERGESAYWWPAAVTTLFTMLVLLYVCCIRSRIAFASANLQVACKSVLGYPVILLIAVLFTLVQIAWALVWIVATYAAINHGEYIGQGKEYSASKKLGILVGMVLIFFWATCVCRNIVMVATAGTVSSWWHHSTQDRQAMTSTRALCRALTLSFGSICFGSLIVSIIQTIRFILMSWRQALKNQGNAVAACLVGCIGCLVACVQKWVEYFNRFAYSYVGIYGYNFVGSGKRVCQLFASKGWSAIMNDSLIANVLLFGKVVVGFLGAAAGWGCAVYGDDKWTARVSQPEAALGISGFLIGYSVADVIMTVIDGAVATIFILFAEDPYALTSSHPNAHEALHKTWKEIYPDEYERSIKRPDERV